MTQAELDADDRRTAEYLDRCIAPDRRRSRRLAAERNRVAVPTNERIEEVSNAVLRRRMDQAEELRRRQGRRG